jgi:glycosyltransferase involved in cell wall biosynthesis
VTDTPSAPNSVPKVCAVVVAAFNVPRWIRECLQSIQAQNTTPGWTYDLRIGVDGCRETARVLQDLKQEHWYSEQNVGPHVLRNTLIQLAPADSIAVFDADDTMRPTYLSTLLPLAGDDGIAGAARQSMDARGWTRGGALPFNNGVSVYSRAAWDRLGGFRSWRIAADADAYERAQALGIPIRAHPAPLFNRRLHRDSLTGSYEQGLSSVARQLLKDDGRELIRQGMTHVIPETTPLTYWDSRTPS